MYAVVLFYTIYCHICTMLLIEAKLIILSLQTSFQAPNTFHEFVKCGCQSYRCCYTCIVLFFYHRDETTTIIFPGKNPCKKKPVMSIASTGHDIRILVVKISFVPAFHPRLSFCCSQGFINFTYFNRSNKNVCCGWYI